MSVGVRNGGIDLIRAVSIVLVLLHHFNIAYDLRNSAAGAVLSPWLVHAICRNGNYGVTMFFTISGYLIASNALVRWGRLRDIGLRDFYARRVARILPCLLLLLAIVTPLGLAGAGMFANNAEYGPPVPFWLGDLSALFFWVNVLMGHAGWFNYCLCVLWSLSVEEVFYLAFPVLCVTLRRPAAIAGVAVLLILVGPLYRALHQDDENAFLFAYLACFDGIAIGVCAAMMARGRVAAWATRPVMWVVGTAMIALYLWRSIGSTNVWGVTAMALGTAVLLLGLSRQSQTVASPGPIRSGFEWIGRHSYELYLFHLVVLATMRTVLPPETIRPQAVLPWLLLYLLAALGVAAVVGRLYAEPANRALRRVLLRRRAGVGVG